MKKIRLIQLLFLSLFLIGTYLPTQAQKIDTISVYSTSMKKQIKNIIILPASYTQNTEKIPGSLSAPRLWRMLRYVGHLYKTRSGSNGF